MTRGTLLTDLYNVTYNAGTYGKTQRFLLADEEFEDFTQFPLVVIESGPEEDEPLANLQSRVTFHPAVHIYIEDDTAANVETWIDGARNAIMNNATLRADSMEAPQVEAIDVSVSENRKLYHARIQVKLVFDITHT